MRHLHLAPVVALVLCGAPLVAHAQTPDQANARAVADARRALSAGRADEAIRLADGVLARSPGDRDGADVKIRALTSQGDTARARAAYLQYAQATRRDDAALLAPVAVAELRRVAEGAAGDLPLRMAALERLARSGDEASLVQIQRLSAENQGLTGGVLADTALARLGDPAAAKRLGEAASSPRIRDKSVVAQAIEDAGAASQADALTALLHDASPVTRGAAAEALGTLRVGQAVPELRRLWSQADEDPRVRARAALALKRLGDHTADAQVASMLKSRAADVRLAALDASPEIHVGERLSIIREALQDQEPLARARAAAALVKDDPEAARAVLLGLLDDPDVSVRIEAAAAFDRTGATDMRVLCGLMGYRDGWTRACAAGGVLAAARSK